MPTRAWPRRSAIRSVRATRSSSAMHRATRSGRLGRPTRWSTRPTRVVSGTNALFFEHSDHEHLRRQSQCQVNATDESAARLNGTNPTTATKYLNLTTAPAAPEAEVYRLAMRTASLAWAMFCNGASVVASALTAPPLANLAGGVPKWLTNRVEILDLNSGSPARLFQYLHDTNSPRSRALLQKFDALAESLGLDDELLDELLADLKSN